MEGYISVTAHFVADWKMIYYVLATAGFVQHHTGANIGKRLVEMTQDVEITSKVSAVVHDEVANQRAAVRKAAQETTDKKLGGAWESVICVAHRLKTCLRHAFEQPEIAQMVSAGRKIVFLRKCVHVWESEQAKREERNRTGYFTLQVVVVCTA